MSENIYNPEFVKRLFNRMSASYERMNFITSFGFSIRWRRQFLNSFQPTGQQIQVIDLLTGMGETWGAVKKRFPNATLSALDFSEEMLKRASQKNKVHFGSRIGLLQQDILENNLPDNYYDIVICAFGLKTFSDEQLGVLAKEVLRILKPEGQFSFVEVSKPDNHILYGLYKFYLKGAIPVLGRVFLGNPTEYKMLWHYTERFVNAKRIMQIFSATGLNVSFKSYFYGCATGMVGNKRNE